MSGFTQLLTPFLLLTDKLRKVQKALFLMVLQPLKPAYFSSKPRFNTLKMQFFAKNEAPQEHHRV
jgi:hypothetical protein